MKLGRPSTYTQAVAELYALADPGNGEVRYIGKANDTQERLKAHMRDSLRRRTPVYDWIRSLAAKGRAPVAIVLMVAWDWRWAEKQLISQFRADVGSRLLNVADGGDEPCCPIDVRRENGRKNVAAREANPRKKRIWELKRSIGYALKAGIVSEVTKQKLRLAAQKCPAIFGAWASI